MTKDFLRLSMQIGYCFWPRPSLLHWQMTGRHANAVKIWQNIKNLSRKTKNKFKKFQEKIQEFSRIFQEVSRILDTQSSFLFLS